MRFPNDSRVCFVGDSLTSANQVLSRVVDFYNKSFPSDKVYFYNCGTSGGSYSTAIKFFRDDVLRHAPTHAVVAFGVNDSCIGFLAEERSTARLQKLKDAYEAFKSNVKAYCDILTQSNVSITLCTPAPYDEYSEGTPEYRGGYALVAGYAEFVREFAAQSGIALCDYHDYMTAMLQCDTEPIYSPDRVHPLPHGYYLMAKCFLEHQGFVISDKEAPIPEYLDNWRDTVARLRPIYGAEQLVIRNYALPLEEKLALIEEKIAKQDWQRPIIEKFIRTYAKERPEMDALYREIDRIYQAEVLKR